MMHQKCSFLVILLTYIYLALSVEEIPIAPPANVCDYFNDDGISSNMCQKQNFPSKTIEEIYGSDVSKCCEGHGFIYVDECDQRSQFQGKEVCGFSDNDRFTENLSVREGYDLCPKECRDNIELFDGDYSIHNGGKLQITNLQKEMYVKQYCASHICDEFDQQWVPTIRVCLCMEEEELQKMANNEIEFQFFDKICPDFKTNLGKNSKCADGISNAVTFSEFNLLNDTHIEAKDPLLDKIVLKLDDNDYCIGPKWQTNADNYKELIKMTLFYCKQTPYMRTDNPTDSNNPSSSVNPMPFLHEALIGINFILNLIAN